MEQIKKHRIKNALYRKFLDEGIIEILKHEDIVKVLNNIKGKNAKEARALVICLYLTGARPVEVLNMKAKDISKESQFILAKVPASKNGLPRTIYLQIRNSLAKELLNFAMSLMGERYLFWNFRGSSRQKYITDNGFLKEYNVITYKLRYYFKIWFNSLIPPYFLRHNRFSQLSQDGASMDQLKNLKGAKSYESIQPYTHLSSDSAKKIARKIK